MAKRDREWVSGGQLGVAVDNDTPDGLRRAICDILEPKETVIRYVGFSSAIFIYTLGRVLMRKQAFNTYSPEIILLRFRKR
eukprot:9473110-Pyramimonas_sp.AAC.1